MRTTFVEAETGIKLSNRIDDRIEKLEMNGFVVKNIAYQFAIDDCRVCHYTALITYTAAEIKFGIETVPTYC